MKLESLLNLKEVDTATREIIDQLDPFLKLPGHEQPNNVIEELQAKINYLEDSLQIVQMNATQTVSQNNNMAQNHSIIKPETLLSHYYTKFKRGATPMDSQREKPSQASNSDVEQIKKEFEVFRVTVLSSLK